MSRSRLRGGLRLTHENLLEFKILALLHDPPYKSLLINEVVKSNQTLTKSLAHENEANAILCILSKLSPLKDIFQGINIRNIRIKTSDRIASSFDRWEIDSLKLKLERKCKNEHDQASNEVLSEYLREICNDKCKCDVRSSFTMGLVSIFDPLLRLIYRREAGHTLSREKIRCLFETILEENLSSGNLYAIINVFETIYEPLWYMWFPEIISPADTRVPTHSIFDHLYATASTVNIVAPAKSNETIAGLLVGVSIAPLRDWLVASRKLSDLWIASWLASVMVWYTVKDLVWCLGPDILLLPGFRWNQLYYALLKEKLGGNYVLVRDVVEGFGFFEGFPYYAWQPAFQVLLLPIIRSGQALADYGECNEVVKILHIDGGDISKALGEVTKEVKYYLKRRFHEAWMHVVEAVEERAPGRLGEFIGRLKDMGLLDEPPLELIVAIKQLYVNGKEKYVEAKKIYAEKFNELMAEMEEMEARVLPGWARNQELQDITRSKGAPICPLITDRIDKEIGEHRWRSCSVCKHAPAVLWVPGRDLPDGEVTSDYKEWAMGVLCSRNMDNQENKDDLETCWRKWRPVFKPGERLCPYCLVKRLLGLNEVFESLGAKLLGIRPEKEVSFPSTSDMAGLSVKIALLKLASMIVSGKVKINEIDNDIIENLSVSLGRSRIHEDLQKLVKNESSRNNLLKHIKELVEERWWTPKLLWLGVKELYNDIKAKENTISDWELRFSAAVLLFVDSELEEALHSNTRAREALKKLNEMLRRVRNSVKDKDTLKIIDVIREALASPRKYYSIIWFDGDKYGLLKRGILGTDIGKYVDEIDVYKYLRKLFDTVYKDIDRIKKDPRYYSRVKVSKRILDAYVNKEVSLPSNSLIKLCENGSIPCGSVIVSPAYHYALANAISYTSLRAAIVAERLGGIPVYMAGDEGLIIAPTWLPWELLPDGVRAGYRGEVRRALELEENIVEELVSSNPALTISLIIRRIYWASSSKAPGFHPVKKRGTGKVYWRIPAIVSNGLSMGVRFAHYRDIMYDELLLTRYLLEEAKANVRDRIWVGDSVAFSYGRPGYTVLRRRDLEGKVYFKIPSTFGTIEDPVKRVRTAGLLLATANLIVGLVEKDIVSNSLFVDREELLGGRDKARHVWGRAFHYGGIHVRNMLKYLFDRNIALNKRKNSVKNEEYLNIIDKVFANMLEILQGAEPEISLLVFEELFNASHMALKSMRGISGE